MVNFSQNVFSPFFVKKPIFFDNLIIFNILYDIFKLSLNFSKLFYGILLRHDRQRYTEHTVSEREICAETQT